MAIENGHFSALRRSLFQECSHSALASATFRSRPTLNLTVLRAGNRNALKRLGIYPGAGRRLPWWYRRPFSGIAPPRRIPRSKQKQRISVQFEHGLPTPLVGGACAQLA